MGAINSSNYLPFIGVGIYPEQRGRSIPSNSEWISRLTLPTDPIGIFILTITNVVVGSAIQVEATDGTVLQTTTATSTSVVLSIQAYAGASPLNSLRVKVRKGSTAPFYRPFETYTTSIVGSQSIYVSQIPEE